MESIYLLSDTEIVRRIGLKIKELRLKQNLSQRSLAEKSCVSISTISRVEEGKIKSLDAVIRLLRCLNKLDILSQLMEEEPISPAEYYKMVNSAVANKRHRASKQIKSTYKIQSEW